MYYNNDYLEFYTTELDGFDDKQLLDYLNRLIPWLYHAKTSFSRTIPSIFCKCTSLCTTNTK